MLLIFGIILYFGLAPLLLTYIMIAIFRKILKTPDADHGIPVFYMLSFVICAVVFLLFGPSVIL